MKRYTLFLVGIIAMAPWLYMTRFVFYFEDDFAFIQRMQIRPDIPYNIWRVYWIFYVRPVSDFANYLSKVPGEAAAGAICAGLLILWWAPLYLLARRIASRPTAFALSACILSFTIACASDIRESIYWQTAMLTYMLPLVLCTWMIALLNHRHAAIVVPILAFLAAGCAESQAIIQFVVLAALTPVLGFRRPMLNAMWATALMLVLIFISPAATIRATELGGHMQVLNALANGIRDAFIPFQLMFVRGPALVGAVLVAAYLGWHRRIKIPISPFFAAAAVVIALVSSVMLMTMGWWGYNGLVPPRAHITVQYIALLTILYCAYTAGRVISSAATNARLGTLPVTLAQC